MCPSASNASTDVFERRLLLAVEVIDPVVLSRVTRDIALAAAGVSRLPFINRSGIFIWLDDGSQRPARIQISAASGRFLRQVVAVPAPSGGGAFGAGAELLRVVLRPGVTYPFEDGVTALRGQLREGPERGAAPVVRARVQFAWFDEASGSWIPSPPSAAEVNALPLDVSPKEVETDVHGEFSAFLRLYGLPARQPDIANGMLRIRLQFTRSDAGVATRVTAPDFVFAPGIPPGCVAEGRVVPGYHNFYWSSLQAV